MFILVSLAPGAEGRGCSLEGKPMNYSSSLSQPPLSICQAQYLSPSPSPMLTFEIFTTLQLCEDPTTRAAPGCHLLRLQTLIKLLENRNPESEPCRLHQRGRRSQTQSLSLRGVYGSHCSEQARMDTVQLACLQQTHVLPPRAWRFG